MWLTPMKEDYPCTRFYGEPCDPYNCCGGRNSKGEDRMAGRVELDDLIRRFTAELKKPTRDGGKKRSKGEKPPWYLDDGHEAAAFRHIAKWKSGETIDPDSGTHTLVHAAWRLLGIACIEMGNVPANFSAEEKDPGFA